MTTPPNETVLDAMRLLKAILIQVGTGERRIQDAEGEYAQLRKKVATGLQSVGIKDPNNFHSLWDWYAYWRSNNLATYQSRRDFVSSLYRPVVEALEQSPTPSEQSEQVQQPFSIRHGYAAGKQVPPIKIREDAPAGLRRMILDIAAQTGWDYEGLFNVAAILGKRSWENPEPRHVGIAPFHDLNQLMLRWEWFKVYDFIEKIYAEMLQWQILGDPEDEFRNKLNEYFEYSGVGWRLEDGKVIARGSEAFDASIRAAVPTLTTAGLQTAEGEIHEALSDLSRRPKPDLTGAVQHAMAALECVARKVSGETNLTLGKLLERDRNLVPKPLDVAVEKAWGYASERGRHIREGDEPTRDEAELIVGIAAVVASFLARKFL